MCVSYTAQSCPAPWYFPTLRASVPIVQSIDLVAELKTLQACNLQLLVFDLKLPRV